MSPPALTGPKMLGDRFLELGLITRSQLDAALEYQANAPRPRRLGRTLVQLGFVKHRDVSLALSVHRAIPVLPFSIADVEAAAIAAIPAPVAHRHRVLPCRIVGGSLLIAATDTLPTDAIEELGRVSGRPVLLYLAGEADVEAALRKHYGAPPIDPARLHRLAALVQQLVDCPNDGCLRAELERLRSEVDTLLADLDERGDHGARSRDGADVLPADEAAPTAIP